MRIIKVTHCLTCPYSKYRKDLGVLCKITEELVADWDTVDCWDSIPLEDLPEWIDPDCPLGVENEVQEMQT